MILDQQTTFSDKQAAGTSIGSTVSANTLDTRQCGDDIGRELALYAIVNDPGTPGESSTLQAALETSADNVSFTPVYTGPALAAPVKGAMLVPGVALPPGLKRYLRVVYKVAGAAYTVAPTVTAGLVPGGTDHKLDMQVG